ncbi:MAG TPA: sigma-70 family RNA polymerase sigma factor [Thermoleophilaceae bacterium]|nr:sigma-70 family RNA polymerase sigma factor [Thermoleophilaceae bacterium]
MASLVQARRQGIRDARLVEAVRAGEPRAFELLYERHHGPILSFCRHLTGRLEDAEDAVQHTFLSAYREVTGSDAELDLKPWLYTVARNRCLSLLRARRVREGPAAGALWTGRGAHEERAVEAGGMDGLAEEVERREELRALVSDLGELPEPQRAALVLSELDALSHAQIAQVLQVDTAKVRSLVFQARGSLISTRDARNTPCGEIRFQLSTLSGSSLRRRTLRRHVRACAGCREFEVAVRGQHRNLALILPVTAGAGLRGAALKSAVGGGAALAGSGAAAAGGASGVFGGLVGLVAGSGVAQVTAVVAVAVTGTVGVARSDVPERLGIVDGGRLERPAKPPSRDVPVSLAPSESRSEHPDAGGTGADPAAPRDAGPDGSNGQGRADAPGQLKKNSDDGAVPPGLAKKENGGIPPGLAKKGDDWAPPGQAGKGERGTPPGQAKQDGAGNGRQPTKPVPPGQADRPAGGGNGDRTKAVPPGQDKKTAPAPAEPPVATQPEQPAKPTPPGQARDRKPK